MSRCVGQHGVLHAEVLRHTAETSSRGGMPERLMGEGALPTFIEWCTVDVVP
jgi:hypothetical protein